MIYSNQRSWINNGKKTAMMRLSDLQMMLQGCDVESDCEFDSLGSVIHMFSPKILSYADSDVFVKKALLNPHIVALIAHVDCKIDCSPNLAVIRCKNPREVFFSLHNSLAGDLRYCSPSFDTVISGQALIGSGCHIASENVRIGHNCVIEPNVTILPGTSIGDNVIIRSGSVIGAEGFEFKKIGGAVMPVKHFGGVTIESNVEIQSLCTIAKAVFRHDTVIGEHSKIDCRVHVAHAAQIGRRTLIAAGSTLSGSCIIGDDVWIGPGSTVSNEVIIESGARISIGSVVVSDVPKNKTYSGNFARPHRDFLRSLLR